ncbi:hypothetical protein HanRHA438_Chr16g0787421 [Helianthus annuus]|nr:hypothetical protein HanRHA438_Chr16g0787421 [Helianthus annuus]
MGVAGLFGEGAEAGVEVVKGEIDAGEGGVDGLVDVEVMDGGVEELEAVVGSSDTVVDGEGCVVGWGGGKVGICGGYAGGGMVLVEEWRVAVGLEVNWSMDGRSEAEGVVDAKGKMCSTNSTCRE